MQSPQRQSLQYNRKKNASAPHRKTKIWSNRTTSLSMQLTSLKYRIMKYYLKERYALRHISCLSTLHQLGTPAHCNICLLGFVLQQTSFSNLFGAFNGPHYMQSLEVHLSVKNILLLTGKSTPRFVGTVQYHLLPQPHYLNILSSTN